jgi:hypothetical protein
MVNRFVHPVRLVDMSDPQMKKCGELAYRALLPGAESIIQDASIVPAMTMEQRAEFYAEVAKDFRNLEYKGEVRQYDPSFSGRD